MNKAVIIGTALAALLILVILLFATRETTPPFSSTNEPPKTVTVDVPVVTAQTNTVQLTRQFFEPNTIRVADGSQLTLTITSIDLEHTVMLPGGKTLTIPKGTTQTTTIKIDGAAYITCETNCEGTPTLKLDAH